MNSIKKITPAITAIALFTMALPAYANEHLDTVVDPVNVGQPTGALTDIGAVIAGAIQLIIIVAGLIAFVFLLLGGIKWITSGGDQSQVETARNQIIQALIGIIIVLAAWALIILVQEATNACFGLGCEIKLNELFNQ